MGINIGQSIKKRLFVCMLQKRFTTCLYTRKNVTNAVYCVDKVFDHWQSNQILQIYDWYAPQIINNRV